MSRRIDPYEKIRRAYERNSGVRLTAEDVDILWSDDAVRQAATQDRASECPPTPKIKIQKERQEGL